MQLIRICYTCIIYLIISTSFAQEEYEFTNNSEYVQNYNEMLIASNIDSLIEDYDYTCTLYSLENNLSSLNLDYKYANQDLTAFLNYTESKRIAVFVETSHKNNKFGFGRYKINSESFEIVPSSRSNKLSIMNGFFTKLSFDKVQVLATYSRRKLHYKTVEEDVQELSYSSNSEDYYEELNLGFRYKYANLTCAYIVNPNRFRYALTQFTGQSEVIVNKFLVGYQTETLDIGFSSSYINQKASIDINLGMQSDMCRHNITYNYVASNSLAWKEMGLYNKFNKDSSQIKFDSEVKVSDKTKLSINCKVLENHSTDLWYRKFQAKIKLNKIGTYSLARSSYLNSSMEKKVVLNHLLSANIISISPNNIISMTYRLSSKLTDNSNYQKLVISYNNICEWGRTSFGICAKQNIKSNDIAIDSDGFLYESSEKIDDDLTLLCSLTTKAKFNIKAKATTEYSLYSDKLINLKIYLSYLL